MLKKILLSICLLFSNLAHADKPLTVLLDWYPNPDHAPLVIAQELGFFKQHGLEVELISPSDPSSAPKLVAAHQADIAITYQPAFIEQVDKGLPLIYVGSLIDQPLDCLITLKSSAIHTAADFKNKRIGIDNTSISRLFLNNLLAQGHLTEKDVNLVSTHYNLVQSLLSHQVDAVIGVMRNVEIPQIKNQGHEVNAFFPEDYGIPTYEVLIYVTHLDHRQDKRLPLFLAALKQASAYLRAHPQEAWLAFKKRYPEAGHEDFHAAWFASLPYFATEPAHFKAQQWLNLGAFLQQHGMIKQVQPLSRYAINR